MSETLKEEWFRFAYQQTYQPVLAYLRRRIPADDVDDVLSVVMTRAWHTRDGIPSHLREEPLPWFFGVARNVVHEYFRTTTRRHAREIVTDGEDSYTQNTTEDIADRVIQHSVVGAALDLLSDTDREILLLAAWEGLSSTELASVLQVSSAAARVRLHRARTRFAEALHTVEEQ